MVTVDVEEIEVDTPQAGFTDLYSDESDEEMDEEDLDDLNGVTISEVVDEIDFE